VRFPWAAAPIEEDDVYIDLTERLAPYTRVPEAELAPDVPATFMRERPLRAAPLQAQR
jgi:hypothetical protein